MSKVTLQLKGIEKWGSDSRLVKNGSEVAVDKNATDLDLTGTDDLRIESVPAAID